MLEPLLADLESALQHQQWVLALSGALAVPDICAALGSENGQTTGAKYKAWFLENVTPEYPTLEAEDCWKLRCGMLHQGRGLSGNYEGLLFLPPGPFRSRSSTADNHLIVDIEYFVTDVIAAARAWLVAHSTDETVQRNRTELVQWRRGGLAPFVVGIDLLA